MTTTMPRITTQGSSDIQAGQPNAVILPGQDERPSNYRAPHERPVTVRHLTKTIGLALALTGLFMIPQFLIHIPTGIIAPISAGITTGGVMKVRPVESFIIGLTLFLVITLPAPVAYFWLGFANHLPFIAIFAFSFAFGAYYGTLIGLFSWIGSRINQSKIGPGS